MIRKFKKKPVVIEALQYFGDNQNEIIDFTKGKAIINKDYEIIISTLEGDHRVSVRDWVIKGIKGEFYPCKPDIFEATYDVCQEKNDG